MKNPCYYEERFSTAFWYWGVISSPLWITAIALFIFNWKLIFN